jgi:predicted nucleotidyltransferase
MNILKNLTTKELAHPPSFVVSNTCYMVQMGSVAYGVAGETSDWDVYGFCVPHKETIFPHLKGEIVGFGQQVQKFEQWQEHHIKDDSSGREYDFSIYNIVKYFQLCMENNPNMIDSLFVPMRCILHITTVGTHLRDRRKEFLHKGAWHKFKGYAYSQMHKMNSKNPIGKRKELVDKFGYDVKFAYHVVRLLDEVEQIMVEGDLDLERNREQLKSIRRGEWTQDAIKDFFQRKEKELETVYLNSKLPHKPDQERIKSILLECLEIHFGSLSGVVLNTDKYIRAVDDIKAILERL